MNHERIMELCEALEAVSDARQKSLEAWDGVSMMAALILAYRHQRFASGKFHEAVDELLRTIEKDLRDRLDTLHAEMVEAQDD